MHPTTAIHARTLRIQSAKGFSFSDSLAVASASESGCRRLLTEDRQRIDGPPIETPLE